MPSVISFQPPPPSHPSVYLSIGADSTGMHQMTIILLLAVCILLRL